MGEFLKKAFADMKESAKAQHEVDKANFAAVKAERDKQIAEAKERQNAAQTRIDATKKNFITLVLGVMGGLLFSLGMCVIMVFEGMMVWGILVGIVGIVLMLFLIPLCFGFKRAE